MSRPAIVWERIGASGLMFLNAPGVKWAGDVGATLTGSAPPMDGASGHGKPIPSRSTIPFPPVPTP